MARVGVRKDTGKLFFDFQWGGKRRREQTALDDTPQNRKRADQVLRALSVDIDRGDFDYSKYFPNSRSAAEGTTQGGVYGRGLWEAKPDGADSTPVFEVFAQTWFTENEVRWRRTTRDMMRLIVDKQLAPVFGDRAVGTITRADILAFRAEFAKRPGKKKGTTLSPKTVNDTVGVLKSILDEAAARYGFTSPCQLLKRLKVPKSDVTPFTLDEVRLLIATCRPDYRDYITVRAFTGMRTGEVNGLKWPCVDFERREILVRETFTHGKQEGSTPFPRTV